MVETKLTEHITEQKCPQQSAEFRKIIEEMYRVHLDKNADYSPYNINGTVQVGFATRLWDKSARFMSLSGFDIGTGQYSREKEAVNESIEDTLVDMANYAIINLIYRRRKWGK